MRVFVCVCRLFVYIFAANGCISAVCRCFHIKKTKREKKRIKKVKKWRTTLGRRASSIQNNITTLCKLYTHLQSIHIDLLFGVVLLKLTRFSVFSVNHIFFILLSASRFDDLLRGPRKPTESTAYGCVYTIYINIYIFSEEVSHLKAYLLYAVNKRTWP